MNILISKTQKLEISNDPDLIKARQLARDFAIHLGFGIVNQTKIITAVSELIRNVLIYAGKGWITFNAIEDAGKKGLLIKVDDKGPGIANLELVLKGGFSTGRGLGKGLYGTKKLMDEFRIKSEVGSGTEVEIIKWVV
jgi:serine/threonine-protein kinase RsbT